MATDDSGNTHTMTSNRIGGMLTPSKWDKRFMGLAEHVAGWSKDPSTQVGAVIARDNVQISQGFNGFPRGVHDDESKLEDRDLKYQMIIHAEINAILFANEDLYGATVYTWPFAPCCRCAAIIIQAGIKRVVAPAVKDKMLDLRWKKEMDIASAMFIDAGVELCLVS